MLRGYRQLSPRAEKTCSRCKRSFPPEAFPIATARGGRYRRSWCGDCLKRYYKTHRAEKSSGGGQQ
jgi:hypothetical protein